MYLEIIKNNEKNLKLDNLIYTKQTYDWIGPVPTIVQFKISTDRSEYSSNNET